MSKCKHCVKTKTGTLCYPIKHRWFDDDGDFTVRAMPYVLLILGILFFLSALSL